MKLFLCSSGISLGQYCQKILTKSRGFRKNDKNRDGHIVGSGGVYRRGIKPSAHYALKWFKTILCDKSWIEGWIILGQIGPKLSFCLRKLSLKIENYLPIVIHYATMSQKKPLRVGQIMRCNILLFGAKLGTNHPFTLAGDFFEKLTDVSFVYFM